MLSNEHTHKIENNWCQIFWTRKANFGLLTLISDSKFQNSGNGIKNHKILEITRYTIVK